MTLGGGNSRRLDRQTRSLIILGLSGPCFHPDPGSEWHSLRFFGVFTFSLPCSPLSENFFLAPCDDSLSDRAWQSVRRRDSD